MLLRLLIIVLLIFGYLLVARLVRGAVVPALAAVILKWKLP